MIDAGTAVVIAGGIGAWGTVVAAWLDTRRRTNGTSPLAHKLDDLDGRVRRVEQGVARLEGKVGSGSN